MHSNLLIAIYRQLNLLIIIALKERSGQLFVCVQAVFGNFGRFIFRDADVGQ